MLYLLVGNILNAQHLPPKLIQIVCCRLSPLQERLYDVLIANKEFRHIRDSKQTNTLNSIRLMLNICSHPKMIEEAHQTKAKAREPIDEELEALAAALKEHEQRVRPIVSEEHSLIGNVLKNIKGREGSGNRLRGSAGGATSRPKDGSFLDPYDSGKFLVCYRLMATMRQHYPMERIVLVSNYTSTLDLLQRMCR